MKQNKKIDLNRATASYGEVSRCQSLQQRSGTRVDSNTVRPIFGRQDYDFYRQSESLPKTIDASIEVCNRVYKDNPFVKNIIDMMADFTVEGIRITHRNSKIQNFLNDWMKFCNFRLFSERIANTLYRLGNCPIKIVYGKVPSSIEKEWKRTSADIKLTKDVQAYKRIPLKYEILNPSTIDVIGKDISPYIGSPVYGLRLPSGAENDKKRMQDIAIQYNLNISIPDINPIYIDNEYVIPLKNENFRYLFYKKDDWCSKAWPMVHSVLDPLLTLEKMHLADKKALEGAISQIRLWTLGDLEKGIIPTIAAINKLRDVLSNVGSGDSMDIVWGPDLTFKESDPKGYQFLGKAKYEQVMVEIYAGLGVPSSLTGTNTGEGYNSSSISMKAMIERLEYGRHLLLNFWDEQLTLIQKAFGWKYKPVVSFDHKVMTDETLERKILMDLWDRNILSTERMRELCRQDPALEELRVKKEEAKIKAGKMPTKASPYHSTSLQADLKKILLQSGGVAPSELGLELLPKKAGEKMPIELKAKFEPKPKLSSSAPKGTPGQGRPVGKKDSSKRVRKDRPKLAKAEELNDFISLFNWANSAQDEINEIIGTFFMEHTGKKNLRSLTKAESAEFERLKLFVLCNLKPYETIDQKTVAEKLSGTYDDDLLTFATYLMKKFVNKNEREPTLTELRQIQSTAFAIKYEVEEPNINDE